MTFVIVSTKVLTLAALPAKLNVPVPAPLTVTPPLDAADKVPLFAAKVSVRVSLLASARVRAERSTLLATSSVTVMLVGNPRPVGAELLPPVIKL